MVIKISDIIEFVDEVAPRELTEDWDNTGLLIGDKNDTVNKVLICLDVTSEVVSASIHNGINLIISHHPFIFHPVKKIDITEYKGKAIFDIIRNNISVFACHTNFDVAQKGLNSYLAFILGVNQTKGLNFYRQYNGMNYYIGKAGSLNENLSMREFIHWVKDVLKVPVIRFTGDIDKTVKTAAVFCGAFDGNISGLENFKPDVLVTGDVKYHQAVELWEKGFNLIDAGHYYTEIIFVEYMKQLLHDKFKNLDLIAFTQPDPVKYI